VNRGADGYKEAMVMLFDRDGRSILRAVDPDDPMG
jgi:hypothetical protein